MNKIFRLTAVVLIALFVLSFCVCAEQLAVKDAAGFDVDNLLDIELLYCDDEKSYLINMDIISDKEKIDGFVDAFSSFPVYSENDMPENHFIEINFFYDIILDVITVYDSENGVYTNSDEVYYIAFDDIMSLVEELGLEWEENRIGYDPVEGPYQRGDINKDREIDASDAVFVLQHTLFPDLYPIRNINYSMDFNKDGVLDVNDAIHLLQHSLFPKLYPLT